MGCRKSLFHWPPFFRNQEVTRGASWPRPRRCPVRKKVRISFPFLALRKKFKKWRDPNRQFISKMYHTCIFREVFDHLEKILISYWQKKWFNLSKQFQSLSNHIGNHFTWLRTKSSYTQGSQLSSAPINRVVGGSMGRRAGRLQAKTPPAKQKPHPNSRGWLKQLTLHKCKSYRCHSSMLWGIWPRRSFKQLFTCSHHHSQLQYVSFERKPTESGLAA